jgi:hypothetical protein
MCSYSTFGFTVATHFVGLGARNGEQQGFTAG